MSRTLLSEADGYELLKQYGIPVPRSTVVHTAEEAGRAADGIGFPVVAKIVSPQVVHKSDAGGVITGIASAAAAEKAFTAITQNVRVAYPEAEIEGIIIEAEQKPGLELIIGGKTDPAFGKVITIGMGGTLVELLRDVAIRILPVSDDEIRTMIHSLKGYPLIAASGTPLPATRQRSSPSSGRWFTCSLSIRRSGSSISTPLSCTARAVVRLTHGSTPTMRLNRRMMQRQRVRRCRTSCLISGRSQSSVHRRIQAKSGTRSAGTCSSFPAPFTRSTRKARRSSGRLRIRPLPQYRGRWMQR